MCVEVWNIFKHTVISLVWLQSKLLKMSSFIFNINTKTDLAAIWQTSASCHIKRSKEAVDVEEGSIVETIFLPQIIADWQHEFGVSATNERVLTQQIQHTEASGL